MLHRTLLILALSGFFFQGSAPSSPALVEGTVTNKLTGAPVKQAHVMCIKTDSGAGKDASVLKVDTDVSGRFTMQVAPGSYQLVADRLGFARQAYGAHTAEGQGTVLTLSPGQKTSDLTIQLSPYGAIAGRMLDEDGDPLQGVSVQVFRFSYLTGRRELIPIHGTSTNDRGEYRAFGLPPGHYFLLATRSDGPYAPLYYPGVLDFAAASEISLPEGGEIDGADFQLQKFRVYSVRGRIVTPVQDLAESQLQITLAHREGDFAAPTNRLSAKVDMTTGRFEFSDVPPGSYLVVASQLSGRVTLSGRTAVEVRDSAPPDDLTIQLTSGFAVDGKVEMENGNDPPAVKIGLRAPEGLTIGQPPPAVVGPGGRIKFTGVTPGIWELGLDPLPEKFCVQAATFNDVDLLRKRANISSSAQGEIHILLSDKCPQISGAVVTADGQPHSATVVLAPAELELRDSPRTYRVAPTENRGTFLFKGVRPGSYKLFALEEVEPFAWLDPQLLQPVESQGEVISVSEGDRVTRQLVLISPDALSAAH